MPPTVSSARDTEKAQCRTQKPLKTRSRLLMDGTARSLFGALSKVFRAGLGKGRAYEFGQQGSYGTKT
jgi:hypothetical protein